MPVPARWRVDAAESSVTFSARGFWGLARTTGSFTRVSGGAQIDASGLCSGELSVRDRIVELELPIELAEAPGKRLRLTAHSVIEREPLGLGRSPLGMIRGPADLRVDLVLTPGSRGAAAESSNSADDRSLSGHPDCARTRGTRSNVVGTPKLGT